MIQSESSITANKTKSNFAIWNMPASVCLHSGPIMHKLWHFKYRENIKYISVYIILSCKDVIMSVMSADIALNQEKLWFDKKL